MAENRFATFPFLEQFRSFLIAAEIVFLCCLASLVFFLGSLEAQSLEAPIIVSSGAGACVATSEVCGNGIDEDCNGSDILCAGSDRDRDGFAATADCDDANRLVYPGISVSCEAACGLGTKTCQSGGSYTSCSCTPLCEAVGGGRCYYISLLTGVDSNPGTFSQPWKTWRNITSYVETSSRPANWVELKPGDVVYLMSGTYTTTIPLERDVTGIYFRSVNGTASAPITLKAYPGARPVIAPGVQARGIYLLFSNYLRFEGLEIFKAYQDGIKIAESSNIEMRNLHIHQGDGLDNDNMSGVHFNWVTNAQLHHSFLHDNYDRTNADTAGNKTANSRNVVLFGGGNVRLHHNVIFQTPPITAQKTGGCICHKHSTSVIGSTFEVDNNMLWNCALNAISSGAFSTRVHHNLLINSAPIAIADQGGTTHNRDIIIENNTVIGGQGLQYNPTNTWGPIGLLTFRRNIVVDNQGYHNERGILSFHEYGSDEIYDLTVTAGNLVIDNNCYYNSSSNLQWNLFNANGGAYGSRGALYSFFGWKGLGYDLSSQVVNPQLSADFAPTSSACASYGWRAQ